MAIIPTEKLIPYICINISPQTISWIDLVIVKRYFINLFINMGKLKILYKISEDSNPRITPNTILISQLENATNIVSFNLFTSVIIISLLIFGFKAEMINSLNNSIPLIWKLIIKSD